MRPMPPTDVEQALTAWGATCGPAALAAALGLQLVDVRSACVDAQGLFAGHMGVSDMCDALQVLRASVCNIASKVPESATLELLARGGAARLVLVQWRGPWEAHPKRAAQHRHWIANIATSDETWIYDVNEDDWVFFEYWRDYVAPTLMPARGTGWRISWSAEVHR